jgi:SIR2-like protein
MPGHLFIAQGDLTRLACDAWLLPTGRTLQIRSHWLRAAPASLLRRVTASDDPEINVPSTHRTWYFEGRLNTPAGWEERENRTFDMTEWTTDRGWNRPWPTHIVVRGSWSREQQAEETVEGARQFVVEAARSLSGANPAYGRHRHLLALPVVGTGHGGGWASAGAILRRLVRVLQETLDGMDADIALMTFSPEQYTAAQHARLQVLGSGDQLAHWTSVPRELREVGKSLADQSARGRLVLFVGAGVSTGAGLPTWQGLLDGLADDATFDESEKAALSKLPAVDQARLIRDRLERSADRIGRAKPLADSICTRVCADRYSLSHALLANLSVSEVVTTNYDTLFEQASRDAGHPVAVLPYEPAVSQPRWLLKMHGCVTRPDDIVLTREDYLRYAERRGALAAIVQALLITRHMLFVGFSLNDDNFQRIVDEVRKVIRGGPGTASIEADPFGTALLLNPSKLLASLWRQDIDCVAVEPSNGPPSDTPTVNVTGVRHEESYSAAANQLEILLDFVLFQAKNNVGHLLDSRYADLLNDDEKALGALLRDLDRNASAAVKALPAWTLVADVLKAFGHEST